MAPEHVICILFDYLADIKIPTTTLNTTLLEKNSYKQSAVYDLMEIMDENADSPSPLVLVQLYKKKMLRYVNHSLRTGKRDLAPLFEAGYEVATDIENIISYACRK